MNIIRTPVTCFLERLFCDCGGEMKPTGMTYMTHPVQYPHRCDICWAESVMRETYPRTVYEEAATPVTALAAGRPLG